MADYPTVLLFDGPTRLGTLRVDNPTTVGHVLKVASTSPLSVEWGAGGGGGGTDHAALTNLVWTSSAHTGTANRVAAFDGSGAASYLAVGTDLQAYSATLAAIAAGTWTGSTAIITLGTIVTGTWSASTIAVAKGGTGATDAVTARTNLGLAIGANVQAWSARGTWRSLW